MHRFDVSSVFDEETDEFGEDEDEVEGADEGETARPGLTPA